MPERAPLIDALLHRLASQNSGAPPALIETHISWVILTDQHAYKIKKPVDFGFLDFSTLAQRRHFCEEELRLNRRLAPQLYLAVVPCTGHPDDPQLNGVGPVIDYAVKLKRFDQQQLADQLAGSGQLKPSHIDDLAKTLADFHRLAPCSTPGDRHGLPQQILSACLHNFAPIQIEIALEDQSLLDNLRRWTESEHARLQTLLLARKETGWVREGHGDLHLGNLVLIDDRLIPFDCIEFNEDLRWIDVISELAFLIMDLEVRNLSSLAFRLLNRYLEHSGDYAGLALLNYYRIYRAMVRAKIASLTRSQSVDADEKARLGERCLDYLRYATQLTLSRRPSLMITHGFSGSGKSRLAQELAEQLPAIRVSSDIERKRLTGYAAQARTDSHGDEGIYTHAITRQTYDRLLTLAEGLLNAGFSVIVDATFLIEAHRNEQKALANRLGVQFVIIDIQAPIDVLAERIQTRQAQAIDPSEADVTVLESQLAYAQPLQNDERSFTVTVDTSKEPSLARLLADIQQRQA